MTDASCVGQIQPVISRSIRDFLAKRLELASTPEIAEFVGYSRGSVRRILDRLVAELRRRLQ